MSWQVANHGQYIHLIWHKMLISCLLFRTWSSFQDSSDSLHFLLTYTDLNASRNNCGNVTSLAANRPTKHIIYSFYHSFTYFCQKGSEGFESSKQPLFWKKVPLCLFTAHVHELNCSDKPILAFFGKVQNDLSELVCTFGMWYQKVICSNWVIMVIKYICI